MPDRPADLDRVVAVAMAGDGRQAAERWAASGAMALTGRADGPADAGPARVALAMDALAADIARTSAELGAAVHLDGAALLGERAAIAGFTRSGPVSCGGATRLLPSGDGSTIAVSLARDDDWTLLPALFALCGRPDRDVAGWDAFAGEVAALPADQIVDAAIELGLPMSRLGEVTADGPLVRAEPHRVASAGRPPGEPLTVVDLSSLWAGPLCAQVLGLAGARIVKVESAGRPDGARSGPAAFYDLLHAGHESVAIPFGTAEGRGALRRLLRRADVVIEASRPRALAALRAGPDDLAADGWDGIWVSITGYGRHGRAALRIAFGDDAAVAGGLVGGPAGAPTFCADAIADPATGLVAAAATLRAVTAGWSGCLEVSLAGTAAHLAAGVGAHPAVTAATDLEARPPRARVATGRAAPLGAHTAAWLS